jgi:glycosyltransferase involved in cell wall biosynthesis
VDYDIINISGNRIWCADFYFPLVEIFGGFRVATPHDFYQLSMNPNSAINKMYFRRYLPGRLRAFDRYLAMTSREKLRAASLGIPATKIDVVGTAIDIKDFRGEVPEVNLRSRWKFTRRKIGLYVGGMWDNKRVDRIIRGLAPLRDRVALAIVGKDVPTSRCNQAALMQLARELGVEVRFLGKLTREELVSVYREADVFLLGSEYEGFGLSLIEAMASSLPFVAFDAGAAPLLAERGAGFSTSTIEEFTSYVDRITSDDELRAQISRQAGNEAPHWDWTEVSRRYLRVLQGVVAKSGTESDP